MYYTKKIPEPFRNKAKKADPHPAPILIEPAEKSELTPVVRQNSLPSLAAFLLFSNILKKGDE